MTRGDRAKALFQEGYNCSQAVALAFSDVIGMDNETIAKLTSGYGGGMGRMREVCGSVSGAVFVLSALNGYNNPSDNNAKKNLYAKIQELGSEFKNENGSVVCRELLGLSNNGFDTPTPEQRTQQYYQKRPCADIVKSCADILESQLNNK